MNRRDPSPARPILSPLSGGRSARAPRRPWLRGAVIVVAALVPVGVAVLTQL